MCLWSNTGFRSKGENIEREKNSKRCWQLSPAKSNQKILPLWCWLKWGVICLWYHGALLRNESLRLRPRGMSYLKLFTMKVFWLVSGLKGRTLSWRKLQKDVDLSAQMWPGCHLGVTISRLPCQRNLYRHISFDFTKEPQIFDQVCLILFHFTSVLIQLLCMDKIVNQSKGQ